MYPSIGVVLVYLNAAAGVLEPVREGIGNRLDEGTWDPANPVIIWTDGRPPSLGIREDLSICVVQKASQLTVSSFLTTSKMSLRRKES